MNVCMTSRQVPIALRQSYRSTASSSKRIATATRAQIPRVYSPRPSQLFTIADIEIGRNTEPRQRPRPRIQTRPDLFRTRSTSNTLAIEQGHHPCLTISIILFDYHIRTNCASSNGFQKHIPRRCYHVRWSAAQCVSRHPANDRRLGKCIRSRTFHGANHIHRDIERCDYGHCRSFMRRYRLGHCDFAISCV